MRSESKQFTWPMIALLMVFASTHHKARAADESLQFIETNIEKGLFAGVTDEFGSTNTPTTRRLCVSFWTTTNGVRRVAIPTQQQYAFKVEMVGKNGIAVGKTAPGKQAGIRFDAFDGNAFDRGIKLQRFHVDARDLPSQLVPLFRPSDLFVAEEPGDYLLQIHLQILALPKQSQNSTNSECQLIRFREVRYPIHVLPRTNAPPARPPG